MAQGLWFEARCEWTVVTVDRGNDSATATFIGPSSGRILKLRSHAALLLSAHERRKPQRPFFSPDSYLDSSGFRCGPKLHGNCMKKTKDVFLHPFEIVIAAPSILTVM